MEQITALGKKRRKTLGNNYAKCILVTFVGFTQPNNDYECAV